jgi:hypothetical protein
MESVTSSWESFYVIVGSSAGALTGLQFVVMALVADVHRRLSADTVAAFSTPNIVHFCAVLVSSAILSAPWRSLTPIAWALAVLNFCGIVYVAIVHNTARRQEGYEPVFEDWLWHVILPYGSYGLAFIAAVVLPFASTVAMDMIGAMALVLLIVGIHNAWDTVTFILLEKSRKEEQKTKVS